MGDGVVVVNEGWCGGGGVVVINTIQYNTIQI